MRKTWQIRGPFGEYLIVRKQDLKSNERAFVEGGSFISANLDELLADSISRDVLLELYKEEFGYLLPEIGNTDFSDIGRFIKPQLDEFFQNEDFVLFRVARLYISGYRELQEGTTIAPTTQSLENRKDEETKTAVLTVIESEAEEKEDEQNIVEFVLESESDGLILPFHKFKVYDVNDNEIASGETDENGEAEIEVSEETDYYIVVDSEETYTVSGKVFQRDGVTPLATVSIDIQPWEEDAITVDTSENGEIELSNIPEGILTISYDDCEYSIYVDCDISNGVFCLPYDEEDEESAEIDESDSYEDYEMDIDEEPDIDPEDY